MPLRLLPTSFVLLLFTALSCGGDSTGDGGGQAGSGGSAGGGGDLRSCAKTSECVVIPESCCGSCGAATRDDIIAINSARSADYGKQVCGEQVGCPACYMEQDANLVATCRAGRCEVVDLLEESFTECSAASDCRLRTHDCCECGGGVDAGQIIAIRTDGESGLVEIICDPQQACPECAPTPPVGFVAECSSGRCRATPDPT